MAEEDSTGGFNFFVHSFGRNNHVNLNFVSVTTHFPHHPISSSCHSILTFAAAALVTFLELKFQGNNESPFETHPKTMFLAVTSFLLYCLAYDVESRFGSLGVNLRVCRVAMAILGPLSLAALFSVLLPQFMLCSVLFSLPILFSLFRLPLSMAAIEVWKWIRELIWAEIVPAEQPQLRSRTLMGLLENVHSEEDDIYNNLPV